MNDNSLIIIIFFIFFAWIIYQVLKFVGSFKIHRYNGLEPQLELIEYLKKQENE